VALLLWGSRHLSLLLVVLVVVLLVLLWLLLLLLALLLWPLPPASRTVVGRFGMAGHRSVRSWPWLCCFRRARPRDEPQRGRRVTPCRFRSTPAARFSS